MVDKVTLVYKHKGMFLSKSDLFGPSHCLSVKMSSLYHVAMCHQSSDLCFNNVHSSSVQTEKPQPLDKNNVNVALGEWGKRKRMCQTHDTIFDYIQWGPFAQLHVGLLTICLSNSPILNIFGFILWHWSCYFISLLAQYSRIWKEKTLLKKFRPKRCF